MSQSWYSEEHLPHALLYEALEGAENRLEKLYELRQSLIEESLRFAPGSIASALYRALLIEYDGILDGWAPAVRLTPSPDDLYGVYDDGD